MLLASSSMCLMEYRSWKSCYGAKEVVCLDTEAGSVWNVAVHFGVSLYIL